MCSRAAHETDVALPYWGDEWAHRGFLLDLGRSVGGTHFLAIDADEIIVAGQGREEDYSELRTVLVQMQPGDIFVVQVIFFDIFVVQVPG